MSSIDLNEYFYDKQIRRYLLQIIRMFSGFQVHNGYNTDGTIKYKVVPCTYADMSRMGANYLNSNSENVLNSAPMLSIHVTDLQPFSEYRYNPHYEGTSHFTEKQQDSSGNFINKPGKKYTVKQLMPAPFKMTLALDLWTTSTEQKCELFEQIAIWYNPGYQFSINSSPFDMSRETNIEMTNTQWTSRSVPQGTSVDIDIMTLTFEVYPVYINAPAKIRRQVKIHDVIANVVNTDQILNNSLDDIFSQQAIETSQVIVTPSGYNLEVSKSGDIYQAKLVNPAGYGTWSDVFALYGDVIENETNFRIRQSNDISDDSKDIYATYTTTSDPQTINLNFNVDTFQSTTLPPVDKIINPNNGIPTGYTTGTRYLLGYDITIPDWGIQAKQWDIIEYDGTQWNISFDATTNTAVQYVINLAKMDLYKFINGEWIAAVMGTYNEGYWMFDVQKIIGTP